METYYTDDLTAARAHARKLARKRHMPHYIVRWPQGYEVVAQIDMYYSKLREAEAVK